MAERGEEETAWGDEARRQARLFAERCDGREGKCKSCRFLLRALDEIDRLSTPRVVWNGTFSQRCAISRTARSLVSGAAAYRVPTPENR